MRTVALLTALAALILAAGPAGAQVAFGRPAVGRVVIDPGHGGSDRGVVSPSGYAESELAFDLARKLARSLEDRFDAVVTLTRRQDENPGPDQRAAVANRVRADVMVSIHAAGSPSAEQQGFRVWHPAPPPGETPPPPAPGPPLPWDRAGSAHADSSRRLAAEMDRAFRDVLKKPGPGPLGAHLAVLTGANAPSVLVEVGFLTHPGESERLQRPAYRDALVRALTLGLESWAFSIHTRP
jgi:N-acetylmuramoyl-L-alanine amidase